jgi:ribonucleotide reductase alpha subunit
VNYNSTTDTSPEKRAEFIDRLTQNTLTAFEAAQNDSQKLQAAVQHYINTAAAANLDLEEIENILGVNEPCIMDLADLSEEDEEIVINAFEQFINT